MLGEILSLFFVFIAIFLYGMTVMKIGLYHLSGNRINNILLSFTNTPMKGLLTGTLVTAVLQSSSAVMIMTIGLVATGYLTFKQTVGIILGTNIGTTITTEMITIDLHYSIIPLLLIGTLLLLQKNKNVFSLGTIFFGLGCIFVAMNGFQSLAKPLYDIHFIKSALQQSSFNQITGIGIGTILTAFIQSSSATTGIVMGFLRENIISITTGTAIILGANIGTCITAFFASIGGIKEAKLTAYAHIWLNVLGVMLFFPFINELTFLAGELSTLPDVQLAHISLLFNVLSSLIALPFVGLFSRFIERVHGRV